MFLANGMGTSGPHIKVNSQAGMLDQRPQAWRQKGWEDIVRCLGHWGREVGVSWTWLLDLLEVNRFQRSLGNRNNQTFPGRSLWPSASPGTLTHGFVGRFC